MKKLKQLTLNLCLKDLANFNNFFIGGNEQLIRVLNNLYVDDAPSCIYFWGKSGCGKSHLLSATSQLFNDHHLSVAYLPLEDLGQISLQILDNLESVELLCIDDLHLIAGNLEWEEKILHCFNKFLVHGKKMVVTANMAPQVLPFKILDLKSRMIGSLIFTLQALTDEEKIVVLKSRSKSRGLKLSDEVAHFLLNHYQRDTKSLFAILEILDRASLVAQRKLTIPFIKDILDDENL